ncbi:hypothetical protein A2U01_0007132, partial [Trifolium medium]|nr:hypothetical protein [Trifolium medium]
MSKQQKLQPDVVVYVNTQLVDGDADSSMGVKRKRRNEKVKPSEATSSQGVDPQLARLAVGRTEIPVKACSSGDKEIEVLHVNMPKTLLPPPAVSASTSFDAVAFIERSLLMQGDSTRFNFMETAELQKLALGHELKGFLLSHFLSGRQEKEVIEAHEQAERVGKTITELEGRYTEAKDKLGKEIEDLKKAKKDEVVKLKKEFNEALAKADDHHLSEMEELKKTHAAVVASLEEKI